MSEISNNNRRIAKNTMMLYIRMLAVMAVSIYTSRVYLAQLGVSDYGLYNVVGGVVAMFAFLNSSLATSTQRFITFNLGTGDKIKLSKVFAGSLNIHIVLGFVIVLLLETGGLWFVNTKLLVPSDRLYAVNWVYQFSVLSCMLSIVQVPYTGIINAHEDMGAFAWLSILDVSFKLLIAYLISIAPFDKLIFFGLLFLLVNILMLSIYRLFCIRHYEEARFKLFWDKPIYSSMMSFAGWNVLGGLAWILKNDGANVLLNMVFGSVVNAARGVAMQITVAVNQFSFLFLSAVFPQITKYYVQDKILEMQHLVNRSLKFSYFIVFILAFPIMLNIDFILSIWLKEVPPQTNIFVILVFVDVLIQSILGAQITAMIMATGNIRNFQIVGSINMLLIIPISYLLLKMGYGADSVFIVIALSGVVSGLIRLYYAHALTGYSYRSYVFEVIIPIGEILALSLPIPIVVKIFYMTQNNFVSFAVLSMLSLILVGVSVYTRGFTQHEREVVRIAIINKLRLSL